MPCDTWDVVSVPFPFTDSSRTKRRPALVLSARPFNESGHVILTMITSAMQPAGPRIPPFTPCKQPGCVVLAAYGSNSLPSIHDCW